MYGKSNVETYTAICTLNGQWELAVCLRTLKQGLCINLKGWGGEGWEMGGRFEQSTLTLFLYLLVRLWESFLIKLVVTYRFVGRIKGDNT